MTKLQANGITGDLNWPTAARTSRTILLCIHWDC